ncbi:outer dense fiber protein 2b [Triplophysa rosa]|uniref:Outer dense fiber protein 2 n=1 Tax=Triplophysa rosa TaxID=992332 RepID=A0A9W7WFB0_TRIRA|nr:outer dense fiber protein 2b [Triplophysa rosa]KAI7797701.1 outer dense fiber of sperm tails 2b [Triplophysa rosa]
MKTRSSSPPLHVHVPDSTSVHVHLKKSPQKWPAAPPLQSKVGHLRSTASVKVRAPWVPPGKTFRRKDYKREGTTRCLEVTPGPSTDPSSPPLRLTDLSSEENNARGATGNISEYERKIERLMSEVDDIKNEVKLRQTEDQLMHQSQQLSARFHLIDKQEEKLETANKELTKSRRDNSDPHSTVDGTHGGPGPTRSEPGAPPHDIETLLRKLVEAEIDGQAAAKQVAVLRETIGKLRKDKKQSKTHSDHLGRHHDLLEQKLKAFEETNRNLRRLLREQHGRETDALRMSDEREMLMRKLAESESDKRKLEAKLNTKERESNQLAENLETERDHLRTTGGLSKVLESTRRRLQSQLHKKEAENNRLEAQIQRLEGTLQQQQEEVQGLLEQMKELKQHCEGDRDINKQILEDQRKRAEHSVNTAAQLSAQLLEKEAQLAEALSAAEELRQRYAKQNRGKSQLELEITTLNNRITELTEQLRSCEEKACAERESQLSRLHSITSESTSVKLENQRLKTTLSATEDRLSLSHSEAQQLKISRKDFENLVESYKSQLQKTRLESEEYSLRLELAEKEVRSERAEVEREVDQGRKQLQARLKELEGLYEALKSSEEELRETRENMNIQHRRNAELTSALSDIRIKIEQNDCKSEMLQEKNLILFEENNKLKSSVDSMERKMEEMSIQNRDLLQVIAKREENLHNTQLRLEEKTRECDSLYRQVEQAREEAQKQVDQNLDRMLSKERSAQSKKLDLETQLSLAKNELGQLRCSKDDMEKRFQCKLQDMKNQLEQVNSTNRSLQNYVHYLKASYTNVFGDSALTSSMNI